MEETMSDQEDTNWPDGYEGPQEVADSELNGMLSFTWCHKKPAIPGWYWYDNQATIGPTMVYVADEQGELWVDFSGHRLPMINITARTRWAGPVPEPKER